jgi:hypothetical protein
LAEALKTNTTLTTLDLEGNDINDEYLGKIKDKLKKNLHPKMEGAAVALELASGLQYPPEIMQVTVQQLVALPPDRREEGLDTIQKLSKSINYPSKKT